MQHCSKLQAILNMTHDFNKTPNLQKRKHQWIGKAFKHFLTSNLRGRLTSVAGRRRNTAVVNINLEFRSKFKINEI